MDWLQLLAANLGSVTFTVISLILFAYLAYAMARPERF
ncbi:MAG: potassium-transporting ATPase subunit F [Thermoplasmata archaeon]|nr:potassium-transporting ATPase subunit F [Thermoplasmata archaeon]